MFPRLSITRRTGYTSLHSLSFCWVRLVSVQQLSVQWLMILIHRFGDILLARKTRGSRQS
jgi:hypothetical protein